MRSRSVRTSFTTKAASLSLSNISTRTRRRFTTSRSISKREGDNLSIEVAIQYNDGYDEKVYSFANNINTVDGGTHLSGFRVRVYADDQCLRTVFRPGKELQRFVDGR